MQAWMDLHLYRKYGRIPKQIGTEDKRSGQEDGDILAIKSFSFHEIENKSWPIKDSSYMRNLEYHHFHINRSGMLEIYE